MGASKSHQSWKGRCHAETLAPTPSAHVRASTLLPTHFQLFPCTRTVRTRPRIHARSCSLVLLPSDFHVFPCTRTVCARVRASTLAHAHRSFSPPISTLSLAPTWSAYVRSTQLAPQAGSRQNENPSIEDAFGKNITESLKSCQLCVRTKPDQSRSMMWMTSAK